jgi:hypothetical protein
MGSLLVPLGVPFRRVTASAPRPRRAGSGAPVEPEAPRDDMAAEIAELGGPEGEDRQDPAPGGSGPLSLPFARRDLERLRLVLLAQRRLREAHGPASARRSVAGKGYFEEAVRWLEIHFGEEGRDLAAQWRGMEPGPAESPEAPGPEAAAAAGEGEEPRRRRRRRRRRRPPAKPAPAA